MDPYRFTVTTHKIYALYGVLALLTLAAALYLIWQAVRAYRHRRQERMQRGASQLGKALIREVERSRVPPLPVVLLVALGLVACAHRSIDQSKACGTGLAGAVQAKRTFKAWSKEYELKIVQGLIQDDAQARVDLTRPVVDKALDLFEAQVDAIEQCAKDGGR